MPVAVEGAVLAALDSETDAALAAVLQATLRTLLAAGAPKAAPHWLALCTQVALGVKPGLPAGQPPARGNTNDLPDLGAQHSTAQHSTAQHSMAQHLTGQLGKAGQLCAE